MNREQALVSFLTNIKESWTWSKLTEKERKDFERRLYINQSQDLIRGTYSERYSCYHAMYDMFLTGLGYYDKPFYWRDEDKEKRGY